MLLAIFSPALRACSTGWGAFLGINPKPISTPSASTKT
jgi:hypothetical protein